MLVNTSPDSRPTVFELMPDENVVAPVQRTRPCKASAADIVESVPDPESLERTLACMLYSNSEVFRIAAETAMRLLQEGRMTFMRADWPQLTGLPPNRAYDTCDLMVKRNIIRNDTPGQRTATYRFNLPQPDMQPSSVSNQTAEPAADNASSSNQTKRITRFIENLKAGGRTTFSSDEWLRFFDMTKSGCSNDLRTAEGLGLIVRTGMDHKRRSVYEINQAPISGVRVDGLTGKQINTLSAIFAAFGSEGFTLYDCGATIKQDPQSLAYYFKLYVKRGILSSERNGTGKNFYRLTISPSSHPRCFRLPAALGPTLHPTTFAPVAAAPATSLVSVNSFLV